MVSGSWFVRYTTDDGGISQGVAKKKLIELLGNLNIPTKDHDSFGGEPWSGYNMGVVKFTAADVIHDAAHWLCAEPERRSLYNFGLSMGKGLYSYDQEEEGAASALGIFIHGLFSVEDAYIHLEHHAWSENGSETFRDVYGVVNVLEPYMRGIDNLRAALVDEPVDQVFHELLGLPHPRELTRIPGDEQYG